MGHYMTKEERIILQTLLDEKRPVSYIARKLGCCRQTVYNEIKRGQYLHNYGYYDKLRYSAERGQQKHDYNQTAKGRPLKIGNDHAFAAYIEHKIIVDRYSPAAALAAAAGGTWEAAQHRDQTGEHNTAGGVRTLGDGSCGQRQRWPKRAADTDGAHEQTGDHHQAARSESGDGAQSHRPVGTQNARIPTEIPVDHHRQRLRVHGV